ncbi:hypothetical protein S40288_03645 [Stachybotrys chartarum IBT 40288]|nr:hypothetical protein S40288_03645 [Stachybotrys chartarum IBT 40288]
MTTPIPQPPGLPVLGNIFDIKPSNTWWSLKTLAEKYGEIFQVKIMGRTVVFVAGAALAEELCDEKRFRKYISGAIVEIRYAVNDALFTAYDHEASWGIAHRIIAPKLSPQSMADHFDEMRDTTAELVKIWKGLGPSRPRAILNDLNRLNLEATTLTLFNVKLDCLTGPEHPMIKAMENSTAEAVQRPTRPSFVNWLLYGNKFKSASREMRKYASDLVQRRKANPTNRQDLLAALMSGVDAETGEGLTESQVIDEIVSMPIGSSTAPCLITAAILFLLRNPETIVKAREELDSVIGNGEFVHEHLAHLPYIEAIQRESLRLSFAAPGFNIEPIPSKSKTPITLGGGKYQIAHDQKLIVVLAGVNRDPNVFEDPLEFMPERMYGDKYDRLPLGVKRYYGNGKRECIGKHYAWQWNMVVLAMLIKELDFEMVDPGYKLVQDGWFNVRPVDFQVRIKSRGL